MPDTDWCFVCVVWCYFNKAEAKAFKKAIAEGRFSRWLRKAFSSVESQRVYGVHPPEEDFSSDSPDENVDGEDVRVQIYDKKVYGMTEMGAYDSFAKFKQGVQTIRVFRKGPRMHKSLPPLVPVPGKETQVYTNWSGNLAQMPNIKEVVILAVHLTAHGKETASATIPRANRAVSEGEEALANSSEESSDAEGDAEASDDEGIASGQSFKIGGGAVAVGAKKTAGDKSGRVEAEWTALEYEGIVNFNARKCPQPYENSCQASLHNLAPVVALWEKSSGRKIEKKHKEAACTALHKKQYVGRRRRHQSAWRVTFRWPV